jgi:HAE1 family hydrophobic/amphiphilic exporter-1
MTARRCASRKNYAQTAQICIERPVFATMLILALTVIGGFSFFGLGVDLLPKIDLPTVIVTIVNPGLPGTS